METQNQKAVLAALHRAGNGVRMDALASDAGLTRSKAEAVVTELEDKGFVRVNAGWTRLTLRGQGPAQRAAD